MSAPAIISAARARGLRIAVAESSAGGLIMAALTAVPGASAVMEVGIVAYSNAAKSNLLGVRADTLADHGAVSEEVARAMAEGLLHRASADLAVAETGITGPGGSDVKPEGRCCFALARRDADTISTTAEFGAPGREAARIAFRDHALALLSQAVGQPAPHPKGDA